MKFTSKSEAFSYTLSLLTQINTAYKNNKKIEFCIKKVLIYFNNHEQNIQKLSILLQALLDTHSLNTTDSTSITALIQAINGSDYQQSLQEKFENPLARRAEAELPVLLLQEPTQAMMLSVKKISDEILKVIYDMKKENTIDHFLYSLSEKANVIALGAFKKTPSYKEVKTILTDNDPKQLAEIMHIHFKFARNVFRNQPLRYTPRRLPVGKLLNILKQKWVETDNLVDIFGDQGIGSSSALGKDCRSFISDYLFCCADLYTAENGHKGRADNFSNTRYHQLGLMLSTQQALAKDLPITSFSWAPDCKCQPADLQSRYVLDLIDNDAVYVAGPSGMTSLLLGQMEILGNLKSIKLKQHYLLAVVSYIVGGGFHSLHEVIGPAQYVLDLVPGYNITPPSKKRVKASPPNYHLFYKQQAAIDPEFSEKYDIAYHNYLTFFNEVYAKTKKLDLSNIQRPVTKNVISQSKKHSPLRLAILTNNLDEVKKLINNGYSLNKKNRHGESMLHSAIQMGNIDIVKYLVRHGADVNAENDDKDTIWQYAYQSVFQEKTENQLNRWKILKFIINNLSDINQKDKNGETILHYAVMNKHLKLINYLISHQANVNVKNNNHDSPISYALQTRRWKIINRLVQNGAYLNHNECKKYFSAVLKYFIKRNKLNLSKEDHFHYWERPQDTYPVKLQNMLNIIYDNHKTSEEKLNLIHEIGIDGLVHVNNKKRKKALFDNMLPSSLAYQEKMLMLYCHAIQLEQFITVVHHNQPLQEMMSRKVS